MIRKVILLTLIVLITTTSYSLLEIKHSQLVARDYQLQDVAYFNNRYTTYFYLLNAGNEPTRLVNVNLNGFAIPYNCYPDSPPPIKQAYILQYYCVTDIIACSDTKEFTYTPEFEYVYYTDEKGDHIRELTLPRKRVVVKSPLQLVDPKNKTLLELTLNKGYRLGLLLENKGLTKLNASFEVQVPTYTLLEIHTPEGTILPEDMNKYYVEVEPGDEVPLIFYLIPKYPGSGEQLKIRVFDKRDPCVDDTFVWDVTVWAVFGRLVRVLSSTDFLSVVLLLAGVLFVLNKDKLLKR